MNYLEQLQLVGLGVSIFVSPNIEDRIFFELSFFFSECNKLSIDYLGGDFQYFNFHPYLGKWSNLTI